MIFSTSPPDEKRRLAVLREYAVLDTLPEPALDELAALAAQLCEVPIALVSLVDEQRQWFKSRIGLEARETPREHSFCAHALGQTELLIVPDTVQDVRFARNPLVTGELGIRFYAGAPLVAPGGAVLGTLCVLDREPRTLTPAQTQALGVLSRQVMAHLDLHRRACELGVSESSAREEAEGVARRLAAIVESSDDAIIGKDLQSIITSWNRGAEKIFGYTAEEMVGTSILRLIPADRREEEGQILGMIGRGQSVQHFETQRLTKAGDLIEISVTASPIRDATGEVVGISKIARDISVLKEREREIARLTRLYAALSQVNQAIVWMPSRAELFQKVCQVLVEFGGFDMAWIGWADPATHRLLPVAEFGDENNYLQNVEIYTDDRPGGRGPAGTAYREGRPSVGNDLANDPAMLPWRGEVERRGWRAAAAFPIRMQNEVCGTLTVYALEVGFFRDKEVALLVEAAGDLSFGLDNLVREEAREQAQAVAQSEKLFSDTMIESMPGILYFYDDQGRFLRWNENFATVSGYSGAEIAGMHPLDFFASADQRPLAERIAEVFAQGESSIEASFLSKDGRATPYFFTGKRVQFEGRACLVGVGIDISEQKRAEAALRRSEQRFRSTLDGILEGCQLIGFDWRYLYLNAAAALHNRRPNAELLGRIMPEMWPGIEDSAFFALLRRCLEARAPFHEETEFTFLDGGKGWFDVRCQPVPEGIFVLSIDISERHEAELALRELNETLEHKVTERTAELQAALVRAEAADRLKSAFLATMSHELRTPLNSIIGFTGVVLQGLSGPLNAEQTKQLGMVRSSARHLLELINDVLDLSKIEAGQLRVHAEAFDLRALLERALASVKVLADKKGLALSAVLAPELNEIVSDRRRVEQIVLNLLNNAIKFTDRGGVTLTAGIVADFQPTPAAQPQPAVRIVVVDTGIGIKAEDLTVLFQPFRQVDTGLARGHEGSGLGLVICLRLAALLGGRISVTSVWSQGSEFTVTLPLQKAWAP